MLRVACCGRCYNRFFTLDAFLRRSLSTGRRGSFARLGPRHQLPFHSHEAASNASSTELHPKRDRVEKLAEDHHLQDLFRSSIKQKNGPSQPQAQPMSDSRPSPEHLGARGNTRHRYESLEEATFARKAAQIVHHRNIRAFEALWQEIERWLIDVAKRGNSEVVKEDTAQATGQSMTSTANTSQWKELQTRKGPNICDQCIAGFMTLRRPAKAIQVWNTMIGLGLEPTRITWNSMLHGCQQVQDIKSLEDIWGRMRAAGLEPDVACWTSRIHGLMRCGRWKQSLAALYEMGQSWGEAAKQHLAAAGAKDMETEIPKLHNIGDIAKPTTATVNSVLLGLLRQRRADVARNVLNWATSLGIHRDVVTYNTLLNHAIQEGKSQNALHIFKSMTEAGIRPDLATFTIVLNGFFQTVPAADAPPEKQAEMVSKVFSQMAEAGIHANVYIYGVLIDNLLRRHANLSAAEAVLGHMMTKRLRASPHINAMFLTHHRAQSAPDMEAIGALWERARRESGGTDLILYDRFIEAYASQGQVENMMHVVQVMSSEGHSPSWVILAQILRTLTQASLSDDASQLVTDVVRLQGICSDGIRGASRTRAELTFWQLVQRSHRFNALDLQHDVIAVVETRATTSLPTL